MLYAPSNEEMNAARLLFNSFSTTYMPFVKGDIIVNNGSNSKRKVLATLESLVFVSLKDRFEKADCANFTQTELASAGWQVEIKDWEPENCSKYWYIDSWGDAVAETFFKDQRKCSFRLATNNCFRTKEEAERKRENMLKK